MRRYAFVLLVFCSPVLAHDYENPKLAPWFQSLTSRGAHGASRESCCDGKDATHVADVDWRSKDGHYQVFMEGSWVDVPDSAIVDGPNLSGSTLVWTTHLNGLLHVRCFMPGSGT